MPARKPLLLAIAVAALSGTVVAGACSVAAQAPSLKNSSQQPDSDSSSQTSDTGSAPSSPSQRPSLQTPGQPSDSDSTKAQPDGTTAAHPANDTDASSAASPAAASPDDSADVSSGPPVRAVAQRTGHLSETSKLDIVRTVDGEIAKTLVRLPAGKDGLTIDAGQPAQAGQISGIRRVDSIAIEKGEPVEITNIEFRGKQIVLQINGGNKRKFHLLDHLAIGASEDPGTLGNPNSHRGEGGGSIVVVDYGRPLPEMTPAELKHDVAAVLQFQTEHSATVNWVETLPKEFKDGIQDHHAVVGMNEDMVIAALGRPEHKVRERDDQGNDTEDWIYGNPPAKTTFVTFEDGKVVRVKEFS